MQRSDASVCATPRYKATPRVSEAGPPDTVFEVRRCCLKSGFIEPTEHLVVLLVRRDWQFEEFDRLAQNPAEYFGGLGTCQLTAGNLQLQANKLLRAFKRQSDEASDIISDAIVWYGLSARIGYMSLP